jgi:hypothetical protein
MEDRKKDAMLMVTTIVDTQEEGFRQGDVVCSYNTCGSPRTQSVFVFVGLVSGQTLPIYGYHHC